MDNNGLSASDVLALSGGNLNSNALNGDIIWLFALMALMGGFGGNWGGSVAGNYATQDAMQNGFNQMSTQNMLNGIQSAINSGFGDTALGIAGINQSLCNGFSQAEIANNSRQMASMQQNFNSQTAITGGLNNIQAQLANCCCENRLATQGLQSTIIQENCNDREALNSGLRDLTATITAGTQRILDQMCQDKIDSKNEKIVELQNQLALRDLASSQIAQTAQIIADNTAQTQYIVNRVAPYPIPSYTVPNPYGSGTASG